MGWRPKTDLDAVMVAVVQNGGEATLGEIAKSIDPDEWERIFISHGFERGIKISVQNLSARTRELVRRGKLICTSERAFGGAHTAFRVFSKSDLDVMREELREGLGVTDQERDEIQAIARDAEVQIDLAVGEPTQTHSGALSIKGGISISSNRATAEREFTVTHAELGAFSWLTMIDQMLAEGT